MSDRSISRLAGLGRTAVLTAVFAVVAACQGDAPSSPGSIGAPSLAKGGGGGSSGTAPTVSSTSPSMAFQDTTIDVSVFGSGFTTGAKAAWSLNGDTTKVHVKSTKVISSTELAVRIEIPAFAPVATYDVEVMLTNGKKGVGAEMFEVLQGDPEASFLFPLDDAALGVRSDHLYVSGTTSVYASGVCGVNAKIFATTEASNSGDAVMQMENPRFSARKCADYPRTLTVVFGPGDQQTGTANMNVRHIANTSYSMPIGSTDHHAFVITEARCGGLRWTTQNPAGEYFGGDSVNVTRVDASTWLVESQPYPNNKAHCANNGQLYNIDVRLIVKSDRPLP